MNLHTREVEGPRAPTRGVSGDEERKLIRRAQAGDEAAFTQLLNQYQRKIFAIIHQLIWEVEFVEDIAQEVFIKIYGSMRRYKFEGAFGVWVERITVHQCFDFLRRWRREKQVRETTPVSMEEEDAAAEARAEGVEDATAESLLIAREVARTLLRKLPMEDRALLVLKEAQGASIAELCEIFDLSPSAVKIRLMRARNKLKDYYDRRMKRGSCSKGASAERGVT